MRTGWAIPGLLGCLTAATLAGVGAGVVGQSPTIGVALILGSISILVVEAIALGELLDRRRPASTWRAGP